MLFRSELIRTYLTAADIFVFPSRQEGFPVAPMEAMACGLPVVSADASGMADILGDTESAGGILVPRGHAAALAEALRRLIDDRGLRERLGANGRRRIEERFSLPPVGAQLRTFLERTV